MSFHLFQIREINSNADGSIQFIELLGEVANQQVLSGHSLSVSDGVTTHTFNFGADLPSNLTSGKTMLLATQAFASLGLVTPDLHEGAEAVAPHHGACAERQHGRGCSGGVRDCAGVGGTPTTLNLLL